MDPLGFPANDWCGAFGEPPALSQPLKLALLCGGVGSLEHFLKQNGIAFKAAPFCDICEWLRKPLSFIYGDDAEDVRLGPAGDSWPL